jgi:N-carbamoyl-L-amino-acid hydrolase
LPDRDQIARAPDRDQIAPLPDRDRVSARLTQLWQIALGPGGGADRPAYSPAEAQAMALVAGWAREAGLEPGLDAHGNLWALPPGWDGPLVSSGSHVDTVPDGGRYDGALGTVLGLEIAHALAGGTAAGARPALLVCAAEEAPRFGAGTIGSRLLAGSLAPAELSDLRDADGITAAQALRGYRSALVHLSAVSPPLARLRAHAEIHVAQRRSLREIGVVGRVAGPRRFEIELRGQAGHAGEVPMGERRDALAAAAEIVLAVERAAGQEPAETAATVGTLTVDPGAVSVVPGGARLGLDVRGIDSASLAHLEAAIRATVAQIAARRQVEAGIRTLRAGEPVELDAGLARAALDAARRHGITAGETWSGAGHDAQHLAALTPTLLLFVPLHGGESHTPEEDADAQEIADAAVLALEVLNAAGP